MSSWTDTPFKSIEEAHKTATEFELNPSPIQEKGDYRVFTAVEGNKTYMMAQHNDGGPVRERSFPKRGKDRYKPSQEGPYWSDADSLHSGPWCLETKHKTLSDVEAHWRSVYLNFENVEVISIVLYRIDEDEYEYCKDSQGIWCRVLHRRGK